MHKGKETEKEGRKDLVVAGGVCTFKKIGVMLMKLKEKKSYDLIFSVEEAEHVFELIRELRSQRDLAPSEHKFIDELGKIVEEMCKP